MPFNAATSVLAVGLLIMAAALVSTTRRERAAHDDRSLDDVERRYFARRWRRRVQAGVMVGVVGLLFLGSQAISPRERPSLFVYYWCAVTAVTLWIVALAISDMLSTRMHFLRLMHLRAVEKAALEARVAKLREERDTSAEGSAGV